MLTDLITEAEKAGLELHPDKTKILHNGYRPPRGKHAPVNVQVLGMEIEILPPYRATKYLGRQLQYSTPHATEVEHRIATAWRKFHALKQELTGPTYSQSDRLRLFNGTITPTILYGCEAWTLTAELENRLQRTQRQMLRMIVRVPRRRSTQTTTQATQQPPGNQTSSQNDHQNIDSDDDDDGCDVDSVQPELTPPADDEEEAAEFLEPWVDWIKRATQKSEAAITRLRINSWASTVRQRKWKWMQKLSATSEREWTRQVVQWSPQLEPVYTAKRKAGRPKTRWADDIKKYIGNALGREVAIADILQIASTEDWDTLEADFVRHHD